MASSISFEYLYDEISSILQLPGTEKQQRIQNLGARMIREMNIAELKSLQKRAMSREAPNDTISIIQDLIASVLNIRNDRKETPLP